MRADLLAILPLLVLWGFASLILMVEAFGRGRARAANAPIAVLGVLASLAVVVWRVFPYEEGGSAFAGSFAADTLFASASVACLVTALLGVLMSATYLKNRNLDHGEFYALLLFSISGAMLMAGARDLIVLFLGLEILSFALYVMAGFGRTEERSEEASLKYFLLGAFASAFLLYGIALMYGATQSTNLERIAAVLASGAGRSPLLLASVAMLLVGLGFKAAIVPFHQWTPDVYEGAPTNATALMAGAAKIGAFAAILRVFSALMPIAAGWLPAIDVLAILTMVFGNILAVMQTNVKRLLAYSSIAHAGYLLVAVAAMAHGGVGSDSPYQLGVSSAIFYLFAYTFMTLGAFGVLVYLSSKDRDCQTLDDLRGLARTEPLAAYSMLFFMLSLGGIPPTMGFMGKWQIFLAALNGHEMSLAIIMALASVIGVFYYLKVVWQMCFEEPAGTRATAPVATGGARLSIFISLAATIVLGIAPYLMTSLTSVWTNGPPGVPSAPLPTVALSAESAPRNP